MTVAEAEIFVKKSHPLARLECDMGWMKGNRNFIWLIVDDVRFPPRRLTNKHKTREAAWLAAATRLRQRKTKEMSGEGSDVAV